MSNSSAEHPIPTTFYSERGYIYFNICIHDGLNPELPADEFKEVQKVADNYTYNGIADRNAVNAPMTVDIIPNSAHWRYGETNDRAMEWQKALLK